MRCSLCEGRGQRINPGQSSRDINQLQNIAAPFTIAGLPPSNRCWIVEGCLPTVLRCTTLQPYCS